MYDMGSWKDWNDVFTIHIDGMPEVGKNIEIGLRWMPMYNAHEKIVAVDNDRKHLCWEFQDVPQWVSRPLYRKLYPN